MSDSRRFADSGATLGDFEKHFVVHCPRCEGKALVRADDHRLTCLACFHTENPGRWYGTVRLVVRRRCPECGRQGMSVFETDRIVPQISVKCDNCGDERNYATSVTHLPFSQGWKTDPVFGCRLWLQTNFREHLLWAYNYEHLAYLRNFVQAKLRERGIEPRNTIRKNSSMVSRLPVFLKKAGYRDELTALIDNLEKK
ncbi:MAG: hypothetical protein IPN33_06595 [Saprospiraceae bacterium]|nr:hypothetical protein [Saprospiraceae bacterium]